jgi:hypothetical protein
MSTDRNMNIILPNCDNTGKPEGYFAEDIKRSLGSQTILENVLTAHHTGLFKLESDEKYFELERKVKAAQLVTAFYHGMDRAEIMELWQSHEQYIQRQELNAAKYW